MSDAEGKGLSEQQTRKSSRQKTPNTYYKQDISDIRGEPKPKPTKQQIQKGSKSKKKSDKTSSKQVFNSSSNPQLSQQQAQQQAQGKQAFSKESSKSVDRDDDSENVNIDKDDEPMEVESDPASDAPEGSEHQDSPSLSQEESKKSYQNNANTSYTENEDNSNRPAGGYQTRKIRKKPKFADDNYFDNVPVAKTQQPKKQKTNKAQPTGENQKKPKQLKREGASATVGENLKQIVQNVQSENGNAPTISQEKSIAGAAQLSQMAQNLAKNSQKPTMKQTGVKKSEKQEKQNEEKGKDTANDKALKEKKDTQKKDKTDDILKVGLLDIILDAIHQGNEPSTEAKSNQNANNMSSNNKNNSSNSNNQNQNQNNNSKQYNNNNQINDMSTSNFLNLFNNALNGAQTSNQVNNNQQNTAKGNKRSSEVDKQKLNQMEDQTTQKKKQKTSKKDKKDQGNSEGTSQAASMENIQTDQKNSKKGEIRSVSTSIENGIPKINDNILRESNGNNQQSVSVNGTIYNYPNINSKSDYITHVDKTKEKFILHHSSFEPMVINRIYLKDDVQKKIDMQQLLSQITLQQIQKQQQQQSQQAIQKLYQVAKEQDTQQQQSNSQQNIQYALSMISNILQKGQNFNQQQNNNSQQNQQAQQLQNMLSQLSNVNISSVVNNDKNSAIQQLLQRTLNQNGLANSNNSQNGFNLFANNSNFNEMLMRGLDQFNQYNQTANQLKNINGNKLPNNNLMANKSRSQSQEFEPSLAQKKLSEHFKINTKNNDDEVQSNHSVAATSKPPSRKPSIQNPSIIQGIKVNKDDSIQTKKEIKEEVSSQQQHQSNSIFDDKIEKALNQLEMEIKNQRKNSICNQEEKIKEEASKQFEKKQPKDQDQTKMEIEQNQQNSSSQAAPFDKSKEYKQKQQIDKSIAEPVQEEESDNEVEQNQEQEDSDDNDQEEQNKINLNQQQQQQQQQQQLNNVDEGTKNNGNDFNTSLQQQLLGQQLLEMFLSNMKPQIPEINIKSEIKQELVNHVQPQSQEASSQNN